MGYDLVRESAEVDRMRSEQRAFQLSPAQWRRFSTTFTLSWQRAQFTYNNRRLIPKRPGIYAFIVEYVGGQFPPHGYIMYLGVAGLKPGRDLHARYGEYLRETKRLSIQKMLNDYKDDIFFHYAPLDASPDELKSLETALIDAMMPPINEGDFSAEIKRRRRAM